MPYKLTSVDGTKTIELHDGRPMIVGRAPSSDIPIIDPTISRRHAELHATDKGFLIRDLGSANGTFVNGSRIETGRAAAGDLIAFGKVGFRLLSSDGGAAPPPNVPQLTPTQSSVVLRNLPPREPASPPPTEVRRSIRAKTPPPIAAGPEPVEKSREKLATLLEVSKGLGKSVNLDALLEKIVGFAYQILDVDRVSILLLDGDELVPKIARDKRGGDSDRAVPQSIARTALNDKVAILSDNAGQDMRFGGQSIVLQQIRSAICCPLIGNDDNPLGVLYIDNVKASHRFSEEDFEFSIAFAGIAAVAIENEQFALRIHREAIARSNFERFFAPKLAKQIAESSESIRPGGEKRPVAVLFSDIRGFTALSETMRPDETALLLTEYFTEMVECVFRHDGTLDKFIGDGLMAQWGAPIGSDDDADRALDAAREMMRELDALNAEWRESGRPELQIGIGLNFGEAFAGNIGSERRLEYTIIGDTVNTAKRVCQIAEERQILITDEFRQALHSSPDVVMCEPTDLKNKSQPVTLYRVILD